jgi:hypothetical protein
VDNKQPTPGEWAMIAGGAVTLIGSFLDFAGDSSAWGEGAFPIVTLIVLYSAAVAVLVALTRFASVALPERVLGFTWPQLYLALGFFASLMALGWLVAADDVGAGLFIMLIGSVAVLVGAVLAERERSTPGTLG